MKEAVFPFVKFPGVDTILGPEMKSTGEVMGVGKTFGEAFVKSQMGAGTKLPRPTKADGTPSGKVFISVKNNDKPRAIEVARQMVRNSLETHPESTAELIREALLQLPQAHALIHLHPEDVTMARDYLGEQLTHAGHRLIEDPSVSRGGVRIDAAGSQIDATVQTRWRRIMDNLGRNIHWDGDGS